MNAPNQACQAIVARLEKHIDETEALAAVIAGHVRRQKRDLEDLRRQMSRDQAKPPDNLGKWFEPMVG